MEYPAAMSPPAKPIPIYQPATVAEPPPELEANGAKLWRDILAEWVIEDSSSLMVLEQACHACARAESLRRQIEAEGALVRGAGGAIKANPLLMVELQARGLVARLLARLGVLDTEPKRPPGRPPKAGAW
jgi:hypothetical protein